jgi:hypothetical protein
VAFASFRDHLDLTMPLGMVDVRTSKVSLCPLEVNGALVIHGELLSHAHYSTTLLEANFIRQSFHQVDAAAMRGFKAFCGRWVSDLGAIEPFSFVPNHKGNLLIGHTQTANINMLVRVFVIAVYDGICQGFSQADLDVHFASRVTSALPDEKHELVYER